MLQVWELIGGLLEVIHIFIIYSFAMVGLAGFVLFGFHMIKDVIKVFNMLRNNKRD